MKKNLIKIASLLLVLAMIFSFAACKKDKDNGDSTAPSESSDVGGSTGDETLVTGAGQDDTADGVLIDGLEGSLQVSKNLGVQSVEGFRAVDRQDGNGVLDLGSNKGHGKLLR